MEVSGIVAAEYEDTPSDERPAEILIDAVGLGAGVLDRCNEMALPVRGVNVGETASGRDKYINLKAELWWRCREWLDAKDCKLAEDDTLIGQLCTVRYSFNSSGKVKVEAKEDLTKRGLKSPDVADAFILTFAGGTQRVQDERYTVKQPRRSRSWMTR
jgi:phage terminase large subunit